MAVEKEKIDIVKVLLTNDKIDINFIDIIIIFKIKLKVVTFNFIQIKSFNDILIKNNF